MPCLCVERANFQHYSISQNNCNEHKLEEISLKLNYLIWAIYWFPESTRHNKCCVIAHTFYERTYKLLHWTNIFIITWKLDAFLIWKLGAQSDKEIWTLYHIPKVEFMFIRYGHNYHFETLWSINVANSLNTITYILTVTNVSACQTVIPFMWCHTNGWQL